MVKISQCLPSTRLVGEGRWFEWVNGIRLRILPISTPAYAARSFELREPYRNAIAVDPGCQESREILDRIMRQACSVLVKDVRNVEDEDGKPVVFSTEWLDSVLEGPAGPTLSSFIISSAADLSAYTRAADLADEGNSEGRSAGA